MNKIRLNKENIMHFISFVLIFIALAFTLTKNDFVLGGYIFSKMGISIWSNGTSGLYYPGIISVILIFAGVTDIMIYTKGINKKFVFVIICISFFWRIIAVPVFDFGYGLVKENMKGLASIEYVRQDSSINFKSDKSNLIFEGQIKLQNYSKEKKEFYIKILSNDFLKDLGTSEEIIILDEQDELIKYSIPPKSIGTLNIKFKDINTKHQNINGVGGMDLIIFTEDDEKEFISRNY